MITIAGPHFEVQNPVPFFRMPARQKFAFFGAVVCMTEIPSYIRELHYKDAPSGRYDLRLGARVA